MTHPAEDNVAERGMMAFAQRMRRATAIDEVLAPNAGEPIGPAVLQPTQPWNGYDRRIPHAHGDTALVMGQGGVREI